MYYPLLRGKQEELFALQGLLEKGLLSHEITPVIEPVRLSQILLDTVKKFDEAHRQLLIVRNPIVGILKKELACEPLNDEERRRLLNPATDPDEIKELRAKDKLFKRSMQYPEVFKYENVRSALYFSTNPSKIDSISLFIRDYSGPKLSILFRSREEVYAYRESKEIEKTKIGAYFVPDFQFSKTFEQDLVVFRDKFNRLSRNADYLSVDNEVFSSDHLEYMEKNYKGFSDYSVIGNYFSEHGGRTYAIALHITYFNPENNILRVAHFTSDSNLTDKDTSVKFNEAAKKLAAWQAEHGEITSSGLSSILEKYRNGENPSLGILKRWQIMHHLETMGKYLDRV